MGISRLGKSKTRLRWVVGVTVSLAGLSVGTGGARWLKAAGFQPASTASIAALLPEPPGSPRALVDQYCVSCHNERLKTGGLILDRADLANIPAGAETWEKVAKKVRAGMMPPVGMPRPDKVTLQAFASYLETTIDAAAAGSIHPGRVGAHRLNRSEYANAVRDLLNLNIDVGNLLPPDNESYGFDNMADALSVTPELLEKYVSAALKISRLAVGDPNMQPVMQTERVRPDRSQNGHVEGLPLGTRGGQAMPINFPLDGEYLFQPRLWRTTTEIIRGLEVPSELEILIDGERVHSAKFGGVADDRFEFESIATAGPEIEKRFDVRLPVTAGPHIVGVTFASPSVAPRLDLLQPLLREKIDNQMPNGIPVLDTLTVTGPFNPTGPGDTPSRRQIFICRPATEAEGTPCAKRIVTRLARHAFRGPVSTGQVNALMGFYQQARAEGQPFDGGVQAALARLLASPEFLFRFEIPPANLAPGTPYRLNDLALASRLSFFLWSSIPDEGLLQVAEQGRLSRPMMLERQVRRMLADPKSAALVSNFTGQWLYLRNLEAFAPTSVEFMDFDDNLRQAMRRETELFFKSILDEDRGVLDLLTADYTFVNERLARHYGMRDVYGEQFRRVTLSDTERRGLLGQASILTVTSLGTRTSPVVRGKFVLTNLLGIPPPSQPPNVPALKDTPPGQVLSMRARMEAHRANPACASCHTLMDPIGLSLEHFDGIGRWRDDDGGAAIDAAGQLADGTPVEGASGLSAALTGLGDLFVRNLTKNLMTYALGRGLDYRDMPVIRGIVKDASRDHYRFSSIVMGIVKSAPFTMSTKDLDGRTEASSGAAGR